MKLFIPLILVSTLMLQACGSYSNNTKSISSPTITAPIVPSVVHAIQPEDVATYIENFKQLASQLELQLDGVRYDISLLEFSEDEDLLIVQYKRGLALVGFDFSDEEPIASLTLVEGESSDIEQLLESPDRVLQGTDIAVDVLGDNFTYTGIVTDPVTKNMFEVRLVANSALIEAGNSKIDVEGTSATINGTLGSQTYVQITDLISNFPEVTTLILHTINGSINDDINMHTGRLIRNAQLSTSVPADGDINSGGVDLYAAGVTRTYAARGKLGVHSWCCDERGVPADQLERDDPAHGAQLTYFREMLGQELGPEFYFFTLDASPFETVHVMTQQELGKFLLN